MRQKAPLVNNKVDYLDITLYATEV